MKIDKSMKKIFASKTITFYLVVKIFLGVASNLAIFCVSTSDQMIYEDLARQLIW